MRAQPRLALETAFLKIIEAGNVVAVTTLLGQPGAAPQPGSGPPRQRPAGTAACRRHGRSRPPQPVLRQNLRRPRTGRPEAEPTAVSPQPEPSSPAGYPCRTRALRRQTPAPEAPASPEKSPATSNPDRNRLKHRSRSGRMKRTSAGTGWTLSTMSRDTRCGWPRTCSGRTRSNRLTRNCTCTTAILPIAHFLRQKENRQLLTEYALDFFQKEIKLRFIVPDQQDSGDTADARNPANETAAACQRSVGHHGRRDLQGPGRRYPDRPAKPLTSLQNQSRNTIMDIKQYHAAGPADAGKNGQDPGGSGQRPSSPAPPAAAWCRSRSPAWAR